MLQPKVLIAVEQVINTPGLYAPGVLYTAYEPPRCIVLGRQMVTDSIFD